MQVLEFVQAQLISLHLVCLVPCLQYHKCVQLQHDQRFQHTRCSSMKWQYRAFHNVLRDYKHLWQENQRTYLNGIFHSHRKTEKVFFWQLEMFEVCTTGNMAHIDTIFKFLPHACQQSWCVCGKNLNIVSMCAMSPMVHTSNISSCKKKVSCGCEKFH